MTTSMPRTLFYIAETTLKTKQVFENLRKVERSHNVNVVHIHECLDMYANKDSKQLYTNAFGVVLHPPVNWQLVRTVAHAYTDIKWYHSWLAGVDFMHNVLPVKFTSNKNNNNNNTIDNTNNNNNNNNADANDTNAEFQNMKIFDDTHIITNAKGAYSRSLSEYVLHACLHFAKCTDRLKQQQKTHKYTQFVMDELHGRTIGFVGFGDIATKTAHIAKHAFGMRVLALKNTKTQMKNTDAQLVDQVYYNDDVDDRLEVFRRSDYVVCSLPKTPETIKFCGTKELASMKPTAVFINVGRGVCVDETALIEILKTKMIRGAALDVFENEPLSTDSELWKLDNVLLSPHCADIVPSFDDTGLSVCVQNMECALKGCTQQDQFVTPINKTKGY